MAQRVKVYIPQRNEKRRLKLESFEALMAFANNEMAQYFYLDSDRDWVKMETQEEWEEGIQDMKDIGNTVLTLKIVYKKKIVPRRMERKCPRSESPVMGILDIVRSLLDAHTKNEEPAQKEEKAAPAEEKVDSVVEESAKQESEEVSEEPVVEKESAEPELINIEVEAKEEVPSYEDLADELVESIHSDSGSEISESSEDLDDDLGSLEAEEEVDGRFEDNFEDIPDDVIDSAIEQPNEPVERDEPAQEIQVEDEEEVEEQPSVPLAYSTEMDLLNSMGFENGELNQHILKHNKGDVQKSIEALLRLTTSMHQV